MSTSTNPTKITAPEGLPFVEIEREFDAPVADVYRAHTDPELYAKWVGPHGFTMEIVNFDITSGGSYLYRHVHEDETYEFRGTVHTARENELIIQTWEFLGFPDHPSLERGEFIDLGNGRTLFKGLSVLDSVEGRDGLVQAGMETGVVDGYEKLDALLAEGI